MSSVSELESIGGSESDSEHQVFPENYLLQFNTDEIDGYIETKEFLVTVRQLKGLKDIRRRIKNREYAQMSRDRAKAKMKVIYRDNDRLAARNLWLKQVIADLEFKNSQLTLQVAHERLVNKYQENFFSQS